MDNQSFVQVVMSGLVFKKRRLVKQKRMLLLTNSPRLLYIDPETDTLKGSVPWSDDLEVLVACENVLFFVYVRDELWV